ncbi:hypothetical protein JW977_01505 [Candidatus Falkowbacteria bacterium]|nr:hypothetical protein [Candidatus Falkowbacteria bacterium]
MTEVKKRKKEKLAPLGYTYCSKCDIYFPQKSQAEKERLQKELESKMISEERKSMLPGLVNLTGCPLCAAAFQIKKLSRNLRVSMGHND